MNGGVMQVPTESRNIFSLTIVFTLSSLVLSGCSKGVTNNVTIEPPPPRAIVTMTVTPSSVMPGQSATLTWTTSNATTCTASGAWKGTLTASGSTTVQLQGPAAQTYTLSCSNSSGSSGQNSVTLTSKAECAAPSRVRSHRAKLTHAIANARRAVANGTAGPRAGAAVQPRP